MVGTANYIAPEVLKEEPFDFKIDNFAIGVILAFMYQFSQVGSQGVSPSELPPSPRPSAT
jgi:serine/threonine protein kinase